MDLKKLEIDRGPGRARRRRRGRWVGRLVFLALVAGALWFFRAPLLSQLDRWRLPRVEVAQARRTTQMAQASASGTAANGYVVARRRAALSADAPGRIVELNVEEGTVVQKGDVVARLYADELEASLRRAKAELAAGHTAVDAAGARETAARGRLEEARAAVTAAEATRDEAAAGLELAELEHGRSQRLLESGTDTQERLDRAQTALVQAQARSSNARAALEGARLGVTRAEAEVGVAQAEVVEAEARLPALEAARDLAAASLDKTYVRAPFDGIIVLKDAEVGEVVSPNAQGGQSRGSVATMVDFASLEIQVELPETNLASAVIGAPAEVFLDAFPEDRFAGTVLRIWPTANRQKATVEVRVGLAEIDARMRPDMGARVVFSDAAVPEPAPSAVLSGIQVPGDALVTVEGQASVFVLERDVARLRAVVVAGQRGRSTILERGLEEGERVILSPPDRLADGDRVLVSD